MKQTDPQYKLRIPTELKQQIEDASKASARSMNAEIVARLEESFNSANDLAALKQKMLEMEGDRALEDFKTNQLKSDLIVAQMLVASLAALAKDSLNQLSPAHLEQLEKIVAKEDEMLLLSIENKLERLLSTKAMIDKRIASGQIKVAKEGESTPLGRSVVGFFEQSLQETKELEAMLEKTGYKMPSSKKDEA